VDKNDDVRNRLGAEKRISAARAFFFKSRRLQVEAINDCPESAPQD